MSPKANGNEYFYIRSITGIIEKIVTREGAIVGEYSYDAWGRVLNIAGDEQIINANSFLYKGYYYDFETKLYYCKSRYYDPLFSRWISPDDISYLDHESIGGLNLFAYCGNNPVMRWDPSGCFAISTLLIGILVTTLVCGTVSGISNAVTALGTGQDFGAAFVGGFINGAISGLGVGIGLAFGGLPGLLIAGVIGFVGGYFGSVVETGISTGEWNWGDRIHFVKGGISAAINMITFGISSAFMKEIGQQLTGSFMNRLTQALAPTMDNYILNTVYGGALGFSVGVAGIISYYINGGKYGQPNEKNEKLQIYYIY